MIRWKVVTAEDRGSCSIECRNKKYVKYYRKGKTIEATKGSLGIFVFKTKKQANSFIEDGLSSIYNYTILKVSPKGKGKSPKFICGYPPLLGLISVNNIMRDFYNSLNSLELKWGMKSPEGTICYPAVKVLE